MSRLDDRLEREGEALGARPVGTSIRWGLAVLAIVVVLAIAGGIAHFALGWLGAAGDVVGPGNVKTQYAAVIGDWQALEQEAANACAAKNAAANGSSPTLLEDPAFAYAAKYRSTAADYNRRMANVFEAGLVGPSNCGDVGCPRLAPTLATMQQRVC